MLYLISLFFVKFNFDNLDAFALCTTLKKKRKVKTVVPPETLLVQSQRINQVKIIWIWEDG